MSSGLSGKDSEDHVPVGQLIRSIRKREDATRRTSVDTTFVSDTSSDSGSEFTDGYIREVSQADGWHQRPEGVAQAAACSVTESSEAAAKLEELRKRREKEQEATNTFLEALEWDMRKQATRLLKGSQKNLATMVNLEEKVQKQTLQLKEEQQAKILLVHTAIVTNLEDRLVQQGANTRRGSRAKLVEETKHLLEQAESYQSRIAVLEEKLQDEQVLESRVRQLAKKLELADAERAKDKETITELEKKMGTHRAVAAALELKQHKVLKENQQMKATLAKLEGRLEQQTAILERKMQEHGKTLDENRRMKVAISELESTRSMSQQTTNAVASVSVPREEGHQRDTTTTEKDVAKIKSAKNFLKAKFKEQGRKLKKLAGQNQARKAKGKKKVSHQTSARNPAESRMVEDGEDTAHPTEVSLTQTGQDSQDNVTVDVAYQLTARNEDTMLQTPRDALGDRKAPTNDSVAQIQDQEIAEDEEEDDDDFEQIWATIFDESSADSDSFTPAVRKAAAELHQSEVPAFDAPAENFTEKPVDTDENPLLDEMQGQVAAIKANLIQVAQLGSNQAKAIRQELEYCRRLKDKLASHREEAQNYNWRRVSGSFGKPQVVAPIRTQAIRTNPLFV